MLSSINIEESDVLNILKSLDVNKTHGHNHISNRMLNTIIKYHNYTNTKLLTENQFKQQKV